MSTPSATGTDTLSGSESWSKACCTLPPVRADYTPTGAFSTIDGLKTYSVGAIDAEKAILIVYDIFGFTPQAFQGADLLASQGFRVVMPDFLCGDVASMEMFDGSESGNSKCQEYFSRFPAAIASQSQPVAAVASRLKKDHAKLGVVGFCWGYKVVVTGESIGTFDAVASAHPSMADPSDGDKLTQPLCLLPSGDEDMDVMRKVFEKAEARKPGQNICKQYPSQRHGWMGARGDFDTEDGRNAFRAGYADLVDFFKAHL